MRFLQSYIHKREMWDLLARRAMVQQPTTVLLNVECPGCGLLYFGYDGSPHSSRGQRLLEQGARQLLSAECPDHRHRFVFQ